ncbi:MAG TPA: flagellar motor protein MotB [Polyangiaceae bacterium]|nr:flagellar motor protein MotB [Polyangiaceae bacterium]
MARKKKHEEHVNHERWLVSYADFITLLFAFFVVMFAVSQVDSKKVGRFTQSFNDALEWQVMQQSGGSSGGKQSGMAAIPSQGKPIVPKGKGDSFDFDDEKESIKRGLLHRLGSAPILAGLKVLEVRGELILRLPEKLIFDRGEAIVRPEGQVALEAIAEELGPRPVRMRIEGHTDSTPIHTARFPSNWQLSMARAMAVVAFLLENGRVEAPRLAAAGYGEYHPIEPNETAEGRTQNRRVDLIVVADFDRPRGRAEDDSAKTQPAKDGAKTSETTDDASDKLGELAKHGAKSEGRRADWKHDDVELPKAKSRDGKTDERPEGTSHAKHGEHAEPTR